MPTKKITQLEAYIQAYVKNARKSRVKLNFVRKALALIDEKLGVPCCDDPSATINLHTRFENDLTMTVRSMLAGMPKIGNVKSLTRAHSLLYRFLNPACCVSPSE